jgi:hypothetical protein
MEPRLLMAALVRETGEGWPLLTVETTVREMETQGVQMHICSIQDRCTGILARTAAQVF